MTNETKYNGRTYEEWNAILESERAKVDAAEERVFEASKDVARAAKKQDIQAMKRAARSLDHALKMLDKQMDWIEQLDEITTKAHRYHVGFGPIIEFLEEVYEADMRWYKEISAAHAGKSTKELREAGVSMVEVMISKMPESEAITTFKRDLEARYCKLVRQIEDKVGIVDCFELDRNSNLSFDGFVTGDEGKAKISTIVAGGYNIQRAHYRTLVKLVKK